MGIGMCGLHAYEAQMPVHGAVSCCPGPARSSCVEEGHITPRRDTSHQGGQPCGHTLHTRVCVSCLHTNTQAYGLCCGPANKLLPAASALVQPEPRFLSCSAHACMLTPGHGS